MAVFLFIVHVFCIEENSVDPDQTPPFAASELGQQCLHNTPKDIAGLKGVYFTSSLFNRLCTKFAK